MGTQDETMDTRFSILIAAVSRPTLPKFFQPAARTDYFRSQFRPIMTSVSLHPNQSLRNPFHNCDKLEGSTPPRYYSRAFTNNLGNKRPRRPRVFQNWQAGRHLGVPLLSKSRYTVSNGNSNRDSAAGSYTPPTPTHFRSLFPCTAPHPTHSPPPNGAAWRSSGRPLKSSRRPQSTRFRIPCLLPRRSTSTAPHVLDQTSTSISTPERISRRICSCLAPGLHLSLLQSLYCAGLQAFWVWVAHEARVFGTQGQGRSVARSLRVTDLPTGMPTTTYSCSLDSVRAQARSMSSQIRIQTTPSPPFRLPPPAAPSGTPSPRPWSY
ncbi:hypothetical protein C8F01DRAFT_1127127 [Mycena amicta]|nr:hypothetical protein C8F01DRAFT_1127127 [Mycena amicta]